MPLSNNVSMPPVLYIISDLSHPPVTVICHFDVNNIENFGAQLDIILNKIKHIAYILIFVGSLNDIDIIGLIANNGKGPVLYSGNIIRAGDCVDMGPIEMIKPESIHNLKIIGEEIGEEESC